MNIPQRIVVLLTGLALVTACVFVPWKIKDTLRFEVFPSGGAVWLGHNGGTQYDAFNGALADNDGIHWQALGIELLAIAILGCTLYLVVSPRRRQIVITHASSGPVLDRLTLQHPRLEGHN